uniref:Ribosomal protein eS7 n=1 Tax=Euglena gracilis TaxID=3039 RepID=UPI00174F7CB2|nr:Chain SI, Ribosomal protein eS7 [Euglena gracilis]
MATTQVVGPRKKLRKSARKSATPLEDEVAQAIFDLEVNNKSLKPVLQPLYVNTAKEVDIGHGKRAVVIFSPLRFLKKFHRIHKQLTAELEKKFSGKQVLVIGQRKITRQGKHNKNKIPRTRTAVSVRENILADLLYPVDVVGRRWRHKTDGSKQTKIFLDAREKDKVEGKIEAISVVYKKLTGVDASFGFMTNPLLQQFQ